MSTRLPRHDHEPGGEQVRRARDQGPAVGNPPISRWEYPGFVVYFEHEHVIHSVVSARSSGARPPPPPAAGAEPVGCGQARRASACELNRVKSPTFPRLTATRSRRAFFCCFYPRCPVIRPRPTHRRCPDRQMGQALRRRPGARDRRGGGQGRRAAHRHHPELARRGGAQRGDRLLCEPSVAVRVFPDLETLPYDSFSAHPDITSSRLRRWPSCRARAAASGWWPSTRCCSVSRRAATSRRIRSKCTSARRSTSRRCASGSRRQAMRPSRRWSRTANSRSAARCSTCSRWARTALIASTFWTATSTASATSIPTPNARARSSSGFSCCPRARRR